MIDVSGFEINSLIKFILVLVAVGMTALAALIIKQTGQMVEVLPTPLSPVVRLAGIIYLAACLIGLGLIIVVL